MELTERLVTGAALEVLGTTTVVGGGEGEGEGSLPEVDLKAPWRRVSMNDLVKEKIGMLLYSKCFHRTIPYRVAFILWRFYSGVDNFNPSRVMLLDN